MTLSDGKPQADSPEEAADRLLAQHAHGRAERLRADAARLDELAQLLNDNNAGADDRQEVLSHLLDDGTRTAMALDVELWLRELAFEIDGGDPLPKRLDDPWPVTAIRLRALTPSELDAATQRLEAWCSLFGLVLPREEYRNALQSQHARTTSAKLVLAGRFWAENPIVSDAGRGAAEQRLKEHVAGELPKLQRAMNTRDVTARRPRVTTSRDS